MCNSVNNNNNCENTTMIRHSVSSISTVNKRDNEPGIYYRVREERRGQGGFLSELPANFITLKKNPRTKMAFRFLQAIQKKCVMT